MGGFMIRRAWILALILAAAAALPIANLVRAQSGAAAPAPEDYADSAGRPIKVTGVDLTVFPGRINAYEGNWTFFLRGKGAIGVTAARLLAGGKEYPAGPIENPAPNSALVDVRYDSLSVGGTAQLVLTGGAGEIARVSMPIIPPGEAPPEYRQRHLVRLQLRPYTLAYEQHTAGPDDPIQYRLVKDLGGDEEFLSLLREMAIQRVRKTLPRFTELDSVRWDVGLKREQVIDTKYLRQYLIYLDEARSEDAFLEIFLCFPQVQGAFINLDRTKLPPKERPPAAPTGASG
jgi:hypothetical protein